MKDPLKFTLKDVRCFAGRQEFNIRPLTFLVGENSTGKTTTLGCFQAFSDFIARRSFGDIDFNKDPYQMGSFIDIARKTNRQARAFQLGFECDQLKYMITLIERADGSEPVTAKIENHFPDGVIIVERLKQSKNNNKEDKKSKYKNIFVEEKKSNEFVVSYAKEGASHAHDIRYLDDLYDQLSQETDMPMPDEHNNLLKYMEKNQAFISSLQQAMTRLNAYSFSPVLFKPKRTYDLMRETTSSEESEVPALLMNLNTYNQDHWETLKNKLEKFGNSSDLFTNIDIRKLGRSVRDPFQLQIGVRNIKSNLMGVGYGVSQILAILVRIFPKKSCKFLLQQPEVHLHPRGQAELTSLLVDIYKEQKNSFIIETHSDYLVDRARIEIMRKRLDPDDVSLIYLEPEGNKVKVYNISFDSNANMIGVPGSYRAFFLKEHDRLLGFKG